MDIAFVQVGADGLTLASGVPPDDGLVSLGRMFHEPVWLFYRDDAAAGHQGKSGSLTRQAQLLG